MAELSCANVFASRLIVKLPPRKRGGVSRGRRVAPIVIFWLSNSKDGIHTYDKYGALEQRRFTFEGCGSSQDQTVWTKALLVAGLGLVERQRTLVHVNDTDFKPERLPQPILGEFRDFQVGLMDRVECPRKYQRGRIFREMLSIAGFSRRQNDRRVDFPFANSPMIFDREPMNPDLTC